MNNIIQAEYDNIIAAIDICQLKSKAIVVTGANGLIGSYLVDFLLYADCKYCLDLTIYAISRSKDRLLKRFSENHKNLVLIEQNLNEAFKLDFNPDYLIHAASNAHPIAFATDPVGTMKTNLIGSINLLESIKGCNCKFLYISSGEIYGNNVDHYFSENDLGSIDTKIARSCYPESKRAAETLCVAYAEQFGIHVNIARLCYVYGPTITDSNSRADAQFFRNALAGENIVMKSDGAQKRTYCYVADAVSGILHILLKGKNKEFYNIANTKSIVSVREYAQTLADIADVKLIFNLPDEIEKKGFSKPADSILDASKLQSIGWEPIYDIEQGLKNAYLVKQ